MSSPRWQYRLARFIVLLLVAVESVEQALQLVPVVHGETETVLLARPDAGQVMEGLQLLDGDVWKDDVNGTEKEHGNTEAGEDTPDERTDGGQLQNVELDLGVILSSEQTGLEDVLLGQEVNPLLLLNGAERGLHVAIAIRL